MKKLLTLLCLFMLGFNISVNAADIEVQPTMISRSNAQDRVWVGTFQLAWNDLIDKFVHNAVRFREGTPLSAYELNLKTFTINDISAKCYYKTSERITKNTKKNITKAIKKKFDETSDILDSLDLTPSPDNFIIYVMLKKDFEFLNEFDKLGKSTFKNNQSAEYFGINNKSAEDLRDGVEVLFYNNPNDFAVKLKTKDNDEVYLYKNISNKAFNLIYLDMNKKAKNFNGDTSLGRRDDLKIPNVKFDVTKMFNEYTQKRISGTNFVISQAMESVKFNMDNKGVQLKSEAAIGLMKTSLAAEEPPRHFYFDNTFVIFVKEKGKENPYFALRINDISKFQ